jgi:hypothetical protein
MMEIGTNIRFTIVSEGSPLMSSADIMNAIFSKVKTVLSENQELLESSVTPEHAEEVIRLLGQAAAAGCGEGLKRWLQTAEIDTPTIQHHGKSYRYKLDSEKEFLTPAGIIRLTRRVYQPDAGGPCHVPLDAAWGMEDQFATVEVRDAVLYAAALITPKEVETLFAKCALFHPSATAIKRMVGDMGQWLEEHEDEVLEAIRADEPIPEETHVLCASLDGANVLLSEPGKKKGRPSERPHEDASRERMSPTCYKNAMVGSISLYGEVPPGKKSPKRLVSRYAARMPEDRAPTLKTKFERELQETESRLNESVTRIMLCDGAPGLWNYIDHHPTYTDYEKLVDYHHTTEHLSKAAEAIFGKGSQKAERWYDKYCSKLKGEDGAAKQVLRSMDYYERAGRLCRSRRAALEAERTFFIRNGHRMDYARFRRNGWPIGSGPVEAACKSLVKTRLCRSGMRWSRVGGQSILSLRTYVKSGRWDTMWCEYKRIERLQSPCNTT